jgi:hypothetical protein
MLALTLDNSMGREKGESNTVAWHEGSAASCQIETAERWH